MTSTTRTACLLILAAACAACAATSSPRHTATASAPADPAAARNVILFVGDGMGVSTVTAARILEGQLRGETGEENQLSFERFPHLALARTYNSNQQTPDSAGTITAILAGVKTRAGVLNVDPTPRRGDCRGSQRHARWSLAELARAAGLATGVVTTARVTHATPAALYARSPERDWETDRAMTAAARAAGCVDIARQLLEPADGRGLDLVFGGGRAAFMPRDQRDPEHPELPGARGDGRDLIAAWQQRGGAYAWNARQFADLAPADLPALALFAPSHMAYELDRDQDPAGEPSLAEMTAKAIELLAGRGHGYVLMVEGARIDHAHHAGNAARALHDTIALAHAVAIARARASADTLIVVTADHSHVLTLAGYATRGNPILGLVRGNDRHGDPGELRRDLRGHPYPVLAYANGPGALAASDRQPAGYKRFPHVPARFQGWRGGDALDPQRAEAADFLQGALVPLVEETHGGEDVAVYADGPGAQAVRGVVEQNLLFRWLAQAQPRLRAHLCRQIDCPAEPMASWAAPRWAAPASTRVPP